MIKDVMVRLDGTSGDDVRLAAVNQIAEIFESHITALFFNVLSSFVPDGRNGARAGQAANLLDRAKQAGDIVEATVFERMTRLQHPSNLRRFDVIGDGDISDTTLPLARAVDVFVLLGPNGQSNEPQGLIESLLFETGRHLFLVPDDQKVFLVPDDQKAMVPFENVVVAWNGGRESARARRVSALSAPSKVGILVNGNDAVLHLRHPGINAVKW